MNKQKSRNKFTQNVNTEPAKEGQKPSSFVWKSLIAIAVLGIFIYSNSFDCGFQFDDKSNIVQNQAIRNLSDTHAIWDFDHSRFFAYYTFALNYHLGGLNVWGFHFMNVMIHLLNAFLVFWITLMLFRAPGLKDKPIAKHASAIALTTALLFVSHPLATGAVTYIVQRLASLVTLFYLLSVAMYCQARLSDSKMKYVYFAGTLVAGLFAIHTKENAFTFPFALLLVELYFFSTKKISLNFKDSKVIVALVGFFGFIALALSTFSFSVFNPLQPTNNNPYTISSLNYFYTQLTVIVKYIRLLLLPIGQNIDHDIPMAQSLFGMPTLVSGLFLLALLALAVYLFKRQKLISFGIFWFFLTLSVESSFIPITDFMFEHRTYLPSFGFFLIISSVLFLFAWEKYKTFAIAALVLIIGSNSILAHQRNKVYKDELSLWSDVVAKSPNKVRGHLNLGYVYGNQQQWEQAIPQFNKVNELEPNRHSAAYYNLGIAYWSQQQQQKAMENYSMAIKLDSTYAEAYQGRGVGYHFLNEPDKALADYSKAISLSPQKPDLYYNRGMIYAIKQQWEAAVSDFTTAINASSQNPDYYYNRAHAYGSLNQWEKAAADLKTTLQLNPQHKTAYSNLQYANSRIGSGQK